MGLMIRGLSVLMLSGMALASVTIPPLSSGERPGWEEKSFVGHTRYQPTHVDGRDALRAESEDSASGLFYELKADAANTPMLRWSWRIDDVLSPRPERQKAGDDYPARVYVVFSGGIFFWNTRAINYVWSSSQPVGSEWENAFTDNARMLALRSGPALRRQWVDEERNVYDDYERLFGEAPPPISAIAVMTDTDNGGGRALAWYGDITLAAR